MGSIRDWERSALKHMTTAKNLIYDKRCCATGCGKCEYYISKGGICAVSKLDESIKILSSGRFKRPNRHENIEEM